MKIEILKIKKNNKFLNFLNRNKKQIFLSLILVFVSIFFIKNSAHYINVVIQGILLYGTKILPTLLPFLFVTKLLSNFDFILTICNKFNFVSKFLFKTPPISFYIFFMSVISGYPVGAKLTSEFYDKGIITSVDAQKILSFCSTSGPLFVIGSVGVGFFLSQKIGILLFVIHLISSVINGIIFGHIKMFKKNKQYNQKNITSNINQNGGTTKNNSFSLDDCMYSSIRSVLVVGGFIIIFYVCIQILLDYNLLYPLTKLFEILGLNATESQGFCAGLFEITKGISILSKSSNLKLAFCLSSFLISFSGISILLQSITFLDKTNVNKKVFVFQKFCHGLISLTLAYLVSLFIF